MDRGGGIRQALTEGRAPTPIEALRHLVAVADVYSDQMRAIGRGCMELGSDAPWPSALALAHAAIQAYDAQPQPKRKARRRKSAELEEKGSPGGRAWSKAAKGAKTHASMLNVSSRAMAICAKEEEKNITPPRPGARFWFKFTDDPGRQEIVADKVAQLAKLGVTNIECESREEHEAKKREAEYEACIAGLPSERHHFDSFRFPDPFAEKIRHARIVARDLWQHGETGDAMRLTRALRRAERLTRERWPQYKRKAFHRRKLVAT